MQRKIKRKFVALILAASLAGSSLAAFPMNVFAGTGKNGVIKAPKAKKVTEIFIFGYPANNIIDVGKNLTLTTAFFPPGAYADYKKVTWSSDNTDVATVNETTGEVKAVGAGTVTITATAKNGSDTKTDWVTKDVNITVLQPVTGITISGGPSSNTMDVNETYTLTATLSPENVSDQYKTVEWESSNTNVATVNKTTGEVKAIAPGTAKITSKAGGKEASVDITVIQITLNKSVLALNSDEVESGVHEETLTATVSPEGADKIVSWESNNPGVATVDDNGLVKAVGEGQATITVTTANGFSATCKVYVDVVVVNHNDTPKGRFSSTSALVVGHVKLKFSVEYKNDDMAWYPRYGSSFKLAVKPADDSNIQIQKCVFRYLNNSAEVIEESFEHGGFNTGYNFPAITQVDVYFIRNN